MVYRGPQQMGPANLLYGRPTGYAATMVGLPYDDLNGWRGPYPPEVFAGQFRKVADGWAEGVSELGRAAELAADDEARAAAGSDLRIARAAGLHFASVANQAEFVLARDALLREDIGPEEREERRGEVRRLLEDEVRLARELFALARQDSRIGFEATNHYYYVPQDLVEKVLNCEDLLRRLAGADSPR